MGRKAPAVRRQARSWRSALPLVLFGSAALHLAGSPAWLGFGPGPAPAGTAEGAAVKTGRRNAFAGGLVGAATLLSGPDEAMAFRQDRIQNSKKKYTPKIRAYYQKLEGLRDDIFLQVELVKGDVSSRVEYAARPADWYGGADSKMDGYMVLAGDDGNWGCSEYKLEDSNSVVLVPRGRCTFADKVAYAKAAGAKSVIVYDEKVSKMPLESQGKVGTSRSKGIATREAGDALSGGASILPKEQGVTIMAVPKDQRAELEGVMISRTNGTEILDAFNKGSKPRVLDVKRFEFREGIDRFIKKDLPKMMNEMEIYSNAMRVSKDDMQDPIIKLLKGDRDDFAAAVKKKDYAAIRSTFQKWNNDLDPIGRWELTEEF